MSGVVYDIRTVLDQFLWRSWWRASGERNEEFPVLGSIGDGICCYILEKWLLTDLVRFLLSAGKLIKAYIWCLLVRTKFLWRQVPIQVEHVLLFLLGLILSFLSKCFDNKETSAMGFFHYVGGWERLRYIGYPQKGR